MSRGRHVKVDTDALLEELAQLYEAGETVSGGGVQPIRLADSVPHHRETLSRTLADLEERGEVIQCWGFTDDGPRQSYAPAEAAASIGGEKP